MLAAGASPKDTKINLMDCICLCSEVEITIFFVFYKIFFTSLAQYAQGSNL